MRKILLIFAGLILILMLLSCSDKQDADWTILIYMAADNGLNSSALEDIEEMMAADFSDDITVVVQIDESEYSTNPAGKRYRIQSGSKKLISNLGEIDSGDYNTLTQFANWGFERYPADKKALIIWGHGNGWYNAYNKFCPDNESLSAISVPDGEFRSALQNINSHLDMLIIDACNMLALEVITEIYQFADYILGSETVICPDGFPYDESLTLWEDHLETQSLVQHLTSAYVNSYMPGGSQNPDFNEYEISLAAVKTSEFSDLVQTLTEFVDTWQDSAGTEIFLQSRQDCTIEFNDLFAEIDIRDYFLKLQENSLDADLTADCETILNLLDQIFISHFYIDLDDPNGTQDYPAGTATIWFPNSQTTFENLLSEYEKLNFSATGWQDFVGNSFAN